MRGIPIFTFMNKLDRDGRDPMDLIDELETVLGVQAYPMNCRLEWEKPWKAFLTGTIIGLSYIRMLKKAKWCSWMTTIIRLIMLN